MSTEITHQSDRPSDGLHAGDAEAVGALIDNGFDPARVGSEHQERASAAARLLGLLDLSGSMATESADSLVSVTLARVSRMRNGGRGALGTPTLVPDDDDALEALVASGFQPARVPAAVRVRCSKQMQLLSLLGEPAGDAGVNEALIERTLARVQQAIDAHEERLVVTTRRGGWGGWRLSDLISVAALLLIGSAVLGPMAMGLREGGRRQACQTNMSAAGLGFGAYGLDYADRLPVAGRSAPGTAWWNTGKSIDQSNSANLFVLPGMSYAGMADLNCPGNPRSPRKADWRAVVAQRDWRSLGEVSYSYQSQFSRQRTAWKADVRVAILSDASPVVRRAILGFRIYPFENSPNHGGRGQSVLFNDGSVRWLTTPVLDNNDNIWLPRAIEQIIARLARPHQAEPLNGNETPDCAEDVLLVP